MNDFIAHLPKAELHLHIEGTLEPEMMFAKAQKHRVKLPHANIDALRAAYRFSNLQEFLDLYYAGADVLRDAEDFYDLTWAYLLRAHADSVRHTEIFFDPQTHTARDISLSMVMEGLLAALREGEAKLGLSWRLIPNFLRHLSEQDAFDCLAALEPHLSEVHGFGLDSSEVGHPPEKFAQIFKRVRDMGFPTVAHAGEEGPPSYVWGALDTLGVKRIDHGIRAIDDGNLVAALARRKTPLTVCPLSNQKLCATPDLSQHPLKKLHDAGVVVTINSDDPAYFGGYINENYRAIASALGLSNATLAAIASNSFEASWLPAHDIAAHCAKVEAYVNSAPA